MAAEQLNSARCFGGYVRQFKHTSRVLGCPMTFVAYVPPQAESEKVPVLYWLSGLTCNDQNFITKAGAQRAAAKWGVMLICPDTSPRGCQIEGVDANWDFGHGAGFYVDATEDKWKAQFNMYSYITEELPAVVNAVLPARADRQSIFGHSMGGHGALICALKNPGKYRSVSAFAPICNPINCPWGIKAFSGYLGDNKESWKAYDATELVRGYKGPHLNILIDQGTEDNFYKQGQLLPQNFVRACVEGEVPVALRMQDGYDHSYYFIATFIDAHIEHHAQYLLD